MADRLSTLAGLDTPCGSLANGWRVAVYSRDSTSFRNADIAAYHPSTGRHLVVYEDGSEDTLDLGSEVLRWVLPLNLVAVGPSAVPSGYPGGFANAGVPNGAWPTGGAGSCLPLNGCLKEYVGASAAPEWGSIADTPAADSACWWQPPKLMVPAGVSPVMLGGPRSARRLAALDRRTSAVANPKTLDLALPEAPADGRSFGSAPDLTTHTPGLGLRLGSRCALARATSAPDGPVGLEAALLMELGGAVPLNPTTGRKTLASRTSARAPFPGGLAGAHQPMGPDLPRGLREGGGITEDLLLLGGGRLGLAAPEDDAVADVAEFLCAGGPDEDPLVAACAPKLPLHMLVGIGSTGAEVRRPCAGSACAFHKGWASCGPHSVAPACCFGAVLPFQVCKKPCSPHEVAC